VILGRESPKTSLDHIYRVVKEKSEIDKYAK